MKARLILKTPTLPYENPWVKRGIQTAFLLKQLGVQFRILPCSDVFGWYQPDEDGPWEAFKQEFETPMFDEKECVHLVVGLPFDANKYRSDFVQNSILVTDFPFSAADAEHVRKFSSVWLRDWNAVAGAQRLAFGPKYQCVRSWAQAHESLKDLVKLQEEDDLPELLVDLRDHLSKWL